MTHKLCLSLAVLASLGLAASSASALIQGNITLNIYNGTDKPLETDNSITSACTPQNVSIAPSTAIKFTCVPGQELLLYYNAKGPDEANDASFEFNHIVTSTYSYWTRTDSHPVQLSAYFYGTQGGITDKVLMSPDQTISDTSPATDKLHVNNYNVTITKVS